jgi:hypothetical protein
MYGRAGALLVRYAHSSFYGVDNFEYAALILRQLDLWKNFEHEQNTALCR